jgi:serine/threonine-protein kinase
MPEIGQTISHYRVIEKLGAGGMGVVYRAEDTRLNRQVAIKILPDVFAGDPEFLARFEREARLLASLSHQNIAAIHGLEEADGKRYIVMELAEGETLAKRIRSSPLPVDEALAICRQIAEGMEAAHEKGIVHRDLKPSNVMVSAEGKVKILDFGLARALAGEVIAADLSQSPTITETMTGPGVLLGTAPYMSPEQARGKPLDTRTDIWSFGCVLYETLTGKQAFPGTTTTDVLAKILEREPEWSLLPGAVTENIRCLLRRCLQKDPHRRLRGIGDARIELEDTLAGRIPPVAAAQAASRRPILIATLAGLLLGILGVDLWVWSRAESTVPPPIVRFSFDLPPDQPMKPTWNAQLMFSPDGGILAYSHSVGDAETTFLRRLGELDAKPLASAPGMSIPVFSPDGRYVLLMDSMQSALKKAALSGGAPVLFAPYDMAFRGDWALDNYYYWTTHYFGPIVRTPASGDKQEPVTELDLGRQERTHRHVQVLPGGKAIMFTVSTGGISSFNDARIDLYTLDTKKRKTLVQGGFSPRYSPSGHIVYAHGGSLFAIPFDTKSLEVTGSPVKVVDGVFMSTNSGSAHFDISRTGSLAYAAGKAEGGERTMVWVDREGKASPLPLPPRSYLFPRISPDGKQLAFEIEGVNHDLYTYDPDRDVTTKLTTDGVSHAPVWTPDGKHIAFRSWKAGTMTMWWMPSDRSGPEERLTMVGARQSAVDFSPDGRYLTFTQMEMGGMGMEAGEMAMMGPGGAGMETGGTGIWILPMRGDRTPQRFATSKFIQGSGRFSPDGKWVAYCSNEAGRNEVFVQPWPGPGPKIQISSEGGTDPIWSRNSRELFYRNRDKMMVVAVVTQPTFRASKPQLLWEGRYSHGMSSSCGPPGTTEGNYDVTGDGRRFLMIKDLDEDAESNRIVVVMNFAEELKGLGKEQKQ